MTATRPGVVVATFRRHYTVQLDDGSPIDCVLRGRSTVLACGDRVEVATTHGGGAIASVAPRTSLFYRSDGVRQKLIAANVSQVVGVVAPDLSIDEVLLNRWIVAAESEHCRFVLVANKSDLPGFDALRARLQPYARLGYTVVEMAAKRDVAPLRRELSAQRSVLIGQSGMGKSTLINALVPGAAARIAEVSEALATGRHTTTSTTLYPLDAAGDAWIADSPGMKAFGLAHLEPEVLAEAFAELRPLLGHCRFRDCRHDREPGCVVQEAVARGDVAPQRLALLHELMRESNATRGITR